MSLIIRSTQLYPTQAEYFLLRWDFFIGSQAPVPIDEALAGACEGVAGISPAQFWALLSPEDVADVEAGAIHTKTLHAYAQLFAEGIRSGRLVPAARAKP